MSEQGDHLKGVVTEMLPNAESLIALDTRFETVRCYLSGKMRLHKIRIAIGDRVEIVLPPQSSVGRIVKRL